MKYRVRNADGELAYGSFGEVERAWLMGFIDPDDEIREETASQWRKASSFPLLAQARRSSDQVWVGADHLVLLLTVGVGSLALWFIANGSYVVGGIAALVLAVILIQVTTRVRAKTRPHPPSSAAAGSSAKSERAD